MGILRLGKLCYWVICAVRGFIPFFEQEERVVKGSLKLYWTSQLLLHTDPPCQGQRRNLKGTSDSPFGMRYDAVWRDLRPQPLNDERRTQEQSALGFRPIFPGHRLWLWLWIGSPSLMSSKELFSVETKASEAAAAATKSSQRDSIKSGTRRNFGFALRLIYDPSFGEEEAFNEEEMLDSDSGWVVEWAKVSVVSPMRETGFESPFRHFSFDHCSPALK